jgi:hypothetical protein
MPRRRENPQRPWRPKCRPRVVLATIVLAMALLAAACDSSPPSNSKGSATPATMPSGPSCIKPENGSGCLKLAPADKRADLIRPRFSNPTSVTNPLHPSSRVAQVIYGGQVEGKPFRTEFTRLPGSRTVTWEGQQIETVALQYLAYLDGRIEEVAIDLFAQADDGAVWYFGEDVYNYADGIVADTKGTWHAGREGPPAMIMPAKPEVGTTYRSENIPGLVFEEVTVKAVGQTVPGPSGPISGALLVTELHFDGKREDKVFAPGYGEFSTGNPTGDLEVVSLAVPTDAQPGPLPAQLTTLASAIRRVYEMVGGNDWRGASAATTALRKAWDAHRSSGVPEVLDKQTSRDVDALTTAVAARKPEQAHRAALRVAQDGLDLHLPYQPVLKTDLARLDLWAQQLRIDIASRDAGAVAGDVTTLGWIRDRVRHAVDPAAAMRLDSELRRLQVAAEHEDVDAAAKAAPALLATVAALQSG